MKVLHLGVIRTADDVRTHIKNTKGIDVEFDPKMQASIAALVRDVITQRWAPDLIAFAGHAKRSRVTTADVSLLMRGNEPLMNLVQHRAGLNVKEKTEIKIKRRSRVAELQANGEPSERKKRLSMEEIIARAAAHLADDDSDDSDDDRHRATPEDPSVPEPPLRDDSFDLTTLPHSNTPNLDQPRLPTTSTPLASDHPQPKTPMMNNGLNPVTPITVNQNRQPPAARPSIKSIVETIEEEKDEGNEDSNFSDEPLIVKKNSRTSDDEQEDTPFDFNIEDSNDFDNFTLVKQKSPSVVAETIAEEEEKENEQEQQEQEEDDDFDMPFTVTEKRSCSKEAVNEQNGSQKETQQKAQATQNQDWTKKFTDFDFSNVGDDDDDFDCL